jgi:hypothetical protein
MQESRLKESEKEKLDRIKHEMEEERNQMLAQKQIELEQ